MSAMRSLACSARTESGTTYGGLNTSVLSRASTIRATTVKNAVPAATAITTAASVAAATLRLMRARRDHAGSYRSVRRGERQEVQEDRLAALREDRLRMKLHAPHRVLAVPHGVNLRGVVHGRRGDLERVGEGLALDDERMVPHHLQRTRHALEQPGAVVAHARGLAVHHPARRADHAPAIRLADRLMSEAYAEDRDVGAVSPDRGDADPRLCRRARSGRQHYRVRREFGDALHRDRIVADDVRPLPQFAEVLDEVVREGIVVVDDEEHGPVQST